jgi:hypothetical protein
MLDSDKDCLTKKIREARVKDYFLFIWKIIASGENWVFRSHYQARGSNRLGKMVLIGSVLAI